MKRYRVITGFGPACGIGNPVEKIGFPYTAFDEGNGLQQERGRVFLSCTNDQYQELQRNIKQNALVEISADKDNQTFYAQSILLDIHPSPEEQTFIVEQAHPVSFQDDLFGTFDLDKMLNEFVGSIKIDQHRVTIHLASKDHIETLRWMFHDINTFLEQAKDYAAKQLLDLANDWGYDAWAEDADEDNEEYPELTEEDFAKRITLETIAVEENGKFSLWFDDGDLFWGHSISVFGSQSGGFTSARMQG